jgi:hypothetical protein
VSISSLDTMTWLRHGRSQVFFLKSSDCSHNLKYIMRAVVCGCWCCSVCVCGRGGSRRLVCCVVCAIFFLFFVRHIISPSPSLDSSSSSHITSRSVLVLLVLRHPRDILPCIIVRTHPADETLGKRRNPSQLSEAFLTIFSSLPSANHLCWSKAVLVVPLFHPFMSV